MGRRVLRVAAEPGNFADLTTAEAEAEAITLGLRSGSTVGQRAMRCRQRCPGTCEIHQQRSHKMGAAHVVNECQRILQTTAGLSLEFNRR